MFTCWCGAMKVTTTSTGDRSKRMPEDNHATRRAPLAGVCTSRTGTDWTAGSRDGGGSSKTSRFVHSFRASSIYRFSFPLPLLPSSPHPAVGGACHLGVGLLEIHRRYLS